MIKFFYENERGETMELVLPMTKEVLEEKLRLMKGYHRISYSANGFFLSQFIEKEYFDIRLFNEQLLRLRKAGIFFTPALLATASVFESDDITLFVDSVLGDKIKCIEVTKNDKKRYAQVLHNTGAIGCPYKEEVSSHVNYKAVWSQLQDVWKIASAVNRTFLVKAAF